MSAEDVSVVRTFVECVKAGDVEGALAVLADDVVTVESGSMPHAGTYTGKEGQRRLIGLLHNLFGHLELSDESFYDVGEFVVTRMTATFHSKDGGRQVSMPVAEFYWIEDGKIARSDVYYKDPAQLFDLAEAPLTSPG
ncbi:nuclear transport factor 2 family protein [Mycobacterium sp. C31M]